MRRTREGIYDSHIIGPPGMRVQIILLDMRWFRSPLKLTDQRGAPGKERYLPDPDPAKTMLGDDAMGVARRRAAQARRAAPAGVEHPGAGGRPWLGALGQLPARAPEAFGHDPRQRAPRASCCCRAIAISARSIARRRPTCSPLYEVTSSGINKAFSAAKEPGPNRLGALYAAPNFGVVDIDWWERKVTLALRDEGGTPQRSVDISFDELQLAK